MTKPELHRALANNLALGSTGERVLHSTGRNRLISEGQVQTQSDSISSMTAIGGRFRNAALGQFHSSSINLNWAERKSSNALTAGSCPRRDAYTA